LPVNAPNGQVPFGTGTFFESVERPLNAEFKGGTLGTAGLHEWRVNRDLKAAEGTRPRPSSNHKGGVNVIMCDGSGRFLSESIDPQVYVKLLTTNGTAYGEGKLAENSF
jgi:prepilin-type processing-associated H-X9-DG protein